MKSKPYIVCAALVLGACGAPVDCTPPIGKAECQDRTPVIPGLKPQPTPEPVPEPAKPDDGEKVREGWTKKEVIGKVREHKEVIRDHVKKGIDTIRENEKERRQDIRDRERERREDIRDRRRDAREDRLERRRDAREGRG